MKKRKIALILAGLAALAIAINKIKISDVKTRPSGISQQKGDDGQQGKGISKGESKKLDWSDVPKTIELLHQAAKKLEGQVAEVESWKKERRYIGLLKSAEVDEQLREVDKVKEILETIANTSSKLIPRFASLVELDMSHWEEFGMKIFLEVVNYFPPGTKLEDIQGICFYLQDGWGRYNPETETLQEYFSAALQEKIPKVVIDLEAQLRKLRQILRELDLLSGAVSSIDLKNAKLPEQIEEKKREVEEYILKVELLIEKFREIIAIFK